MEKIYLSKACEKILRAIRDKQYHDIPKSDTEDLLLLEQKGLINVVWCELGYAVIVNLSPKGITYLHVNPKLCNPSIFDDKKFWINTAISLLAVIISIFALLKQ